MLCHFICLDFIILMLLLTYSMERIPSWETNLFSASQEIPHILWNANGHYRFEVRHPRCVSNKSNYKVYAYIVRHNYILGGMLFTICIAQLHVSAIHFGHHQVVQ